MDRRIRPVPIWDDTMSIIPFSRFKLKDIPGSLRMTADRIDSKKYSVVRCLVIMESPDGEVCYSAFGEDFTRLQAVGLCEYVKPLIIGVSSERN